LLRTQTGDQLRTEAFGQRIEISAVRTDLPRAAELGLGHQLLGPQRDDLPTGVEHPLLVQGTAVGAEEPVGGPKVGRVLFGARHDLSQLG
jgi:hypothetical protein